MSSRAEVVQRPAPLLVPLVEEGWLEGEVPRLAVERYLAPLFTAGVDTIVLGCTHYPLLRGTIEAVTRSAAAKVGSDPDGEIAVVDSARATAAELARFLEERDMRRDGDGGLSILVTDHPARFAEVASRFLGRSIDGLAVSAIDL